MRKIVSALILSSALIFAMAVQAAAPSFAGTWTLDKSKSQGLNQRMQGAESVTWNVTQDDKTITIEEKVTGGQMGGGGGAPAGGPPGGGGGGGRGMMGGGMGGPRSFNLDGSETAGEAGRGKFARKASWAGQTLELVSKVAFQGPDGEVTSTTTEKLTLSGDGKTLTVSRKVEGPRPSESTYVFTK